MRGRAWKVRADEWNGQKQFIRTGVQIQESQRKKLMTVPGSQAELEDVGLDLSVSREACVTVQRYILKEAKAR